MWKDVVSFNIMPCEFSESPYILGNQMREKFMGGESITHGRNMKYLQNFSWRTWRDHLGDLFGNGIIILDVKGIAYDGVKWIHVVQNGIHGWDLGTQ
jgi:hypothetical protein